MDTKKRSLLGFCMILFGVIALLSVAGCGNDDDDENDAPPPSPPDVVMVESMVVEVGSLVVVGGKVHENGGGPVILTSELSIKPLFSLAFLDSLLIGADVSFMFVPDVAGFYTLTVRVRNNAGKENVKQVFITAVTGLVLIPNQPNQPNQPATGTNVLTASILGVSTPVRPFVDGVNRGSIDVTTGTVVNNVVGEPFQVNISYPNASVITGVHYSVRYTCTMANPQSIRVEVKNEAGNTHYMPPQSKSCNGTPESIEFIASATDAVAQMALNFGHVVGVFNISGVSFVRL